MQHAQPLKLELLAMRATCDYVTQLCKKVVRVPRPRQEQRDYWINFTNEQINHIQDLVIRYIPCSLANEWLHKFLRILDSELILEVRDRLTDHQWCRMLTREIVAAIIPPSVTKFYCNHRWQFLLPEIYSALKTMKNVQHIKLGYKRQLETEEDFEEEEEEDRPLERWEEDSIISGIQHMKQIRAFSFEKSCTDRIVTALAENHPGLYSLHLEYCEEITDNIIPMMQRFHSLQVLFLVGTNLSDTAVMTLLRELPNGKGLRSYSRNGVTDEEIALLVQQCPNLSNVELMAGNCQNIVPLRKLHNLKRLSISHIEFYSLREVLLVLGDELLELQLFHVMDVDIAFIGKTCLSLRHLSISFCESLISLPEEESLFESSPPGFISLSELQLVEEGYMPIMTYVLCHSFNLTFADIYVRGEDDDRLVDTILRRNHLTQLEQLRWCSSSEIQLSFEGARKILKHCHQLHTFALPKEWHTLPGIEDFLQEMKAEYPGCDIFCS